MVDLENKILDAVSFKLDNDSKMNLYHNNLEISVTKLLHGLGVPSHIKGYQYIREGVILMYEKPDIVGAITKCFGLYFDTLAIVSSALKEVPTITGLLIPFLLS